MNPPTCRVCKIAEYNHRCMGALEIGSKKPDKPAKKIKAPRK